MDLKSFSKENINDFVERAENGNLNNEEEKTLDDLNHKYGDKIKDVVSKFENMSEPELLGEVIQLINKQKENGTFEPEKIKSMAQTIKPLLNSEQQNKMENLLKMLF